MNFAAVSLKLPLLRVKRSNDQSDPALAVRTVTTPAPHPGKPPFQVSKLEALPFDRVEQHLQAHPDPKCLISSQRSERFWGRGLERNSYACIPYRI
jgi:hypothetical protein